MRRTLLALLAVTITTAAFGQTSAEYGRYDAGQLSFQFKAPTRFSGSLGLSTGGGAFGSYGGTLVKDRAWFFASGERFASRTPTVTPQQIDLKTLDGKVFANPTDRQSTTLTIGKVPQFFSMHYTGILSPNAYVSASVSTSKQ